MNIQQIDNLLMNEMHQIYCIELKKKLIPCQICKQELHYADNLALLTNYEIENGSLS